MFMCSCGPTTYCTPQAMHDREGRSNSLKAEGRSCRDGPAAVPPWNYRAKEPYLVPSPKSTWNSSLIRSPSPLPCLFGECMVFGTSFQNGNGPVAVPSGPVERPSSAAAKLAGESHVPPVFRPRARWKRRALRVSST